MKRLALSSAAALGLALAACTAEPADDGNADKPEPTVAPPAATPSPVEGEDEGSGQAAPFRLVAADWVRGEWLKADNRESCAPIAIGEVADRGAKPRPANFGGGWAVAFDLPDKRSAYGVAGAGVESMSEEELRRQWPFTLVPEQLPEGSFAGYGVEGAENYPVEDPDGNTVKSLAYLRVEGQNCLYNVWSNLGRAHLEVMLGSLRMVHSGS